MSNNFEASKNVRTVEWNRRENAVELIDQRLLPNTFKVDSFNTVNKVAKAIKDMVVRGAPAIVSLSVCLRCFCQLCNSYFVYIKTIFVVSNMYNSIAMLFAIARR